MLSVENGAVDLSVDRLRERDRNRAPTGVCVCVCVCSVAGRKEVSLY